MSPPLRGLLIDWGGVLTTDLFASFRAFCETEGLPPDLVVKLFAKDAQARRLLIAIETGRIEEAEFERELAPVLGVAPERLVDRLFNLLGPDQAMLNAVRRARAAGVRTGLISNSWVPRHYDRELLAELFDAVVISGEEGIRKPAPQMYVLGAQRLDLPPAECIYVDDLDFNLVPAAELGMTTIRHVDATDTIGRLEDLLGIVLQPDTE